MKCHEILSRYSISHALGGLEPVRRATCAPACAGYKNNTPSPPKKKLPWLGKSPFSIGDTPRKINMEPKNHPIAKENHLPKHHFQVQAVNLPGCTSTQMVGVLLLLSVSGLVNLNLRKLNTLPPELHKWRFLQSYG